MKHFQEFRMNNLRTIFQTVYNNDIWGAVQSRGLQISDGNNQIVYENNIYNNQYYGLYITDSTNTVLSNNNIYNNPTGVYYEDSSSSIYLNNITNNTYGVRLVSGSFARFDRNNLQNNTSWAFTNTTAGFVKVTNNWFGSTIASSISNVPFSSSYISSLTT